MTDGRHEDPAGRNGWAPVKAQLEYRAKALLAAGGSLVAQEAVLTLTDVNLQQQVQAALPAYAFLVPVVFSALVGLLTHHVANGPAPRPAQPAEDPPVDAGR
jgi:hypothetical protein